MSKYLYHHGFFVYTYDLETNVVMIKFEEGPYGPGHQYYLAQQGIRIEIEHPVFKVFRQDESLFEKFCDMNYVHYKECESEEELKDIVKNHIERYCDSLGQLPAELFKPATS